MNADPRSRRWLADCRELLGPRPRRFSWWTRFGYLFIPRPSWVHRDQLQVLFKEFRDVIMVHGQVVWGHLVQANGTLFSPGKRDAPAEAVYFTDDEHPDPITALGGLAARLFRLKGTTGHPPQAQAIADHLTAEITRAFGLPVPEEWTGGRRAEVSTIFVHRPHLPGRRLVAPFFPLLITPDRPRRVAVVPSRYWPDDLVRTWAGSPN